MHTGAGFLLLALVAEAYLCCYARCPTARIFTGDGRTLKQVEEERLERLTFLAQEEGLGFVGSAHFG